MEVLIVDDEPIAQRILASYIARIPHLRLAGIAGNALEAYSIVSRQPIDLMLLDINMPEISGMAFIKTLKHPPPVIFTTAYTEYAVESYELDAVDYLVKPISFERFLQAIDKAAAARRRLSAAPGKADTKPINPSCALRSDAFEGVSDDKEGCFQIESFGGDCMNAPWHSRLNA